MKRLFNKEQRDLLISKLKDKYQLVIMNADTFDNKFSFKLTPMNLFVAIGTIIIILIIGTTYIIAFTPLREYIPGYSDVHLQENIRILSRKVDILEKDLKTKDLYINNIRNIINDKEITSVGASASTTVAETPSVTVGEKPTANSDKLNKSVPTLNNLYFFTPVKGYLINSYNLAGKHYGVDIVAPKDQLIKATLDGIVIFSEWTIKTGYVIAIQHNNNIVSIYKHNSALLKVQGSFVKAGDPVAIIGNTGSESTGPHLHFEIWYNQIPVNPKEFISF